MTKLRHRDEELFYEAVMTLHSQEDFERDIIQRQVGSLKIYGYRVDGFARTLDSLGSFYNINMELLNADNRRELFCRERPIYTKVRDEVPAIYGLGSEVKNCLIADGCNIEGKVENSILFRGVTVGKDAVVKKKRAFAFE